MIKEKKVIYMTKMASFETHDQKKYEPMKKYYRKDYISIQMIKSFFYGTAAYIIVLIAYGVCRIDEIMAELDSANYAQIGNGLLKTYVIVLFFYMGITYAVYSVRYVKGKRKWRKFERYLKQVRRFYRKKRPENEKNAHIEKETR